MEKSFAFIIIFFFVLCAGLITWAAMEGPKRSRGLQGVHHLLYSSHLVLYRSTYIAYPNLLSPMTKRHHRLSKPNLDYPYLSLPDIDEDEIEDHNKSES